MKLEVSSGASRWPEARDVGLPRFGKMMKSQWEVGSWFVGLVELVEVLLEWNG